MLHDKRICFLGAGNMASALIGGLVAAGTARAEQVTATDIRTDARERLERQFGVRTSEDSRSGVADAAVVVLCVKPQSFPELLGSIAGALANDALVISIAAGIPTALIEHALGAATHVVRAMPNTPALVRAGATGLAAGAAADEGDLAVARAIFESIGITVTVEESLMDAVTGLSGSGPAYVFRLVEGLIEGGTAVGLAEEQARSLAIQTVYGAGKMLHETGSAPAELRTRVTSPGGTTAAGLRTLDERGFLPAVAECVKSATESGQELGKQADESRR